LSRRLFNFGERPAVFDRHHLDEFGPVVLPVVKNVFCPRRAGIAIMIGDELVKTLLVVPAHVGGDVNPSVVLYVPGLMVVLFQKIVFFGHRLQLDHRQVTALGKIAAFVEHVSNAPGHAGGKVAPGSPEHGDNAPGHIFAAVIADPLDHRDGARIAHRETLPGNAAKIAFPLYGSIKHRIADNDRFFGHDAHGLY